MQLEERKGEASTRDLVAWPVIVSTTKKPWLPPKLQNRPFKNDKANGGLTNATDIPYSLSGPARFSIREKQSVLLMYRTHFPDLGRMKS